MFNLAVEMNTKSEFCVSCSALQKLLCTLFLFSKFVILILVVLCHIYLTLSSLYKNGSISMGRPSARGSHVSGVLGRDKPEASLFPANAALNPQPQLEISFTNSSMKCLDSISVWYCRLVKVTEV
jgi:hypothetical protein